MIELDDIQEIKTILQEAQSIAVVGLSPKRERPSNLVGRYLLEAGYNMIPVNPGQDEILGLRCHSDLREIDQKVDVVDIFRKSEDVLPIVKEAIAIGATTVWMQQGIVNREAADLALKSGLHVIMDRCIKVDHAHLL